MSIAIRTLTDGGQEPAAVAAELAEFIDRARESLDLALYDVKLVPGTAAPVTEALEAARRRRVELRLAYNLDFDKPIPVPPPPRVEIEPHELKVVSKPIPGIPDLMHHKFAIRDGGAVWTGSTNWTDDSWSREENVIVTAESRAIAAAFAQDFEQIWRRGKVAGSGRVDPREESVGGVPVRAWFCPERGPAPGCSHREADRRGPPAGPDRLAGAHLRAGAGNARRGRGGRQGRRGRRSRRHSDPRGLRAVAPERALGLEARPARPGAPTRRLLREALHPLQPRRRPRLHAREGDRRGRRRLCRQLQPLALGRDERRERARDRGPRARGGDGGVRRRACALATRAAPEPT